MTQAKEKFKAGLKGKNKIKILKILLASVVILVVLGFFLIPAFVSSKKGQQIILAQINNRIDGKINFTHLSMSWWKGLKVNNFSFSDLSEQTIVKAKQIITKPHYSSILFGSLSFGETIIDEPRVEINLKDGWIEKTEDHRRKLPMSKKTKSLALPIKKIKLTVQNGNLKVTDQQGQTVELSQINSRINLRPMGQQTDFDIDMAVVNGGGFPNAKKRVWGAQGKRSKVRVDGQINPGRTETGWSLKGTNGDLTIEVNDLDISSLGPIFTLAGIDFEGDGNFSANIKSRIKDGQFENLNGTINGRNINISVPQLKGDRFQTSILDVAVELYADKEFINIDKLDIHSDWFDARVSGVIPTTFKSLSEFAKVDSAYSLSGNFRCDLAVALSQMARTFGLKEQLKVTSGQLSGNIQTSTKAGQKEIYGQVTLAELAGVIGQKKIALAEPIRVEAQIISDQTSINFDKLEVSSSFARINCTGPSHLLKYNADVNLAKLQADLGQFIDPGPYQIAGKVFSEGTLSSSEDRITTMGSSVIENLRISSAEGVSVYQQRATVDFSVILDPDKKIANADFIKADTSFGQVSIKDAVLPLSRKIDQAMKLVVFANNIDLEKLQPFAVLFASFPKEIQLAGTGDSQVSISSKNGTYTIKTDSAKIKNLKLMSPGQEPFIQDEVSFIFDGDYNPAQNRWTIRKLKLLSPDIKFQFDFEKTTGHNKTRLKGRIDYEWDWSAISAFMSAFLPKGLKLEGQRADTIIFSSEYPTGQTEEMLSHLNAKGKLGFEKAEYMGLQFGSTETDIQIQNGLLTIAAFSSTVNNGQFKFEGYADLKQRPTLLRTKKPIQILKDIELNDATRELLMYVNPIFANAVNINGLASFYCERLVIPLGPHKAGTLAGSTKKDIEVVGTIWVNNLRLQASDLLSNILSTFGQSLIGQEFTIHPTRFILKDGFLRYENMQIDVGNNPINFRGVIGLDKSLDMTVILPYTLTGRTVRVGEKEISGRISLPLKGTIDKPKLDIGKLLEEQLKQQLRERIIEGLDKLLK